MAKENPEIITLSSDDDSKSHAFIPHQPKKDIKQISKKQKGCGSVSKRDTVKHSENSSKAQVLFVQKLPVTAKNGTKVIQLPVNKPQTVGQKETKFISNNLRPLTRSTKSSELKEGQLFNGRVGKFCPLSGQNSQNFGNRKHVMGVQNSSKSKNMVSNASSQSYLKTNTSIQHQPFIPNTNKGNNLHNIPKSNEAKNHNSNKAIIPFSVLNALQKKGISITNVNEKPVSNSDVSNNKQSESQSYISKLRYSLKRSNTNIDVVPKTQNVSYADGIVKSNNLCQATVQNVKRKITDDTTNPSKLLCVRKSTASSQKMPCNLKNNVPFKIGSEINIIEKSSIVANSSSLHKSSKNVPNSQFSSLCNLSQKDAQGLETSVTTVYSKKGSSSTDSLMQISSKSSLSIIPVDTKNDPIKNISNTKVSLINLHKPVCSQQTDKAISSSRNTKTESALHSTSAPINSSVSIIALNSGIKSSKNRNTTKPSVSGALVENKSLWYNVSKRSHSSATVKPSTTVCKSIDVTTERDALLSFLALCNPADTQKSSSHIKYKTNSSHIAAIVPSSISVYKSNSIIPSTESIKVDDIPNKIRHWPKLVVLLERLDALQEYAEKKSVSHQPVIEIFSLPKTKPKCTNEQESIKSANNDCVNINSKDSLQLLLETSDEKAEWNHFTALKCSADMSISTVGASCEDKDLKNSKNLTNSLGSNHSSIVHLNEINEKFSDEKNLNPSCALNTSFSSLVTLKEDSNCSLNNTLLNKTSLDTNDLSQNDIEMTLINKLENSDICSSTNQNFEELSELKSIGKLDTDNCDISYKDSIGSSNVYNVNNVNVCSEKIENHLLPSASSVESCTVQPFLDVTGHTDPICNMARECSFYEKMCEKVLQDKTDKAFCRTRKNSDCLIDSSNTSVSSLVGNLLNDIVLVIENKLDAETCRNVLNCILDCIVSGIGKDSNSLLTEYHQAKLNDVKHNQELITTSENSPDHSVSQQILEKMCIINNDNINPDITAEFSVPSQEVPEVLNETCLNKEDKNSLSEVICVPETPTFIPFDENSNENLSLDQSVFSNDLSNGLGKLDSTAINNGIEMKLTLSKQQIRHNSSSSSFTGDLIGSPKLGLSFQVDENTIRSNASSGNLNCIIVNVESKYDAFTEEGESNGNFENNSNFKQNPYLGDQEFPVDMGKMPEGSVALKSFYSEELCEDFEDKNVNAHSEDDERKSSIRQMHSQQVTSPKLSLKRNRSGESSELDFRNTSENGYSGENDSKRIKFEQPTLLSSPKQKDQILSNTNLVPFKNVNKEEDNKRKWTELLEFSTTLMEDTSENEKEKIVTIMMKKLGETQSWYVASDKFSSLINITRKRLDRIKQTSTEDAFTILQEVRKEFKKYKCKLKIATVKDTSQDTSSAFSSVFLKNNSVEGNNISSSDLNVSIKPLKNLLTEDMGKHSAAIDNTNEKNLVDYLDSVDSSSVLYPENVDIQHTLASTKDIVEDKEDSIPKISSFHSLLTSESVKMCSFKDSAIDEATANLSAVKSSVLKNSVVEDKYDSLSVPSTSGLCLSTSGIDMHTVLQNNIKEKNNKPPSFALSLQSLESPEPPILKDSDITEVISDMIPSTSKTELFPVVIQSAKSSQNSSLNKTISKEPNWDGDINLSTIPCISADKMKDTIHELQQEKSTKGNTDEAIDSRSAARIKKLEKYLQKLDKKIKSLQRKELSLDDLDDENSPYVMEEKYKRKFNKAWKLLCKTMKQSDRTGRIIEKRFKYEGSRFKSVNVAVEKMINKRKGNQKFPDYTEIRNIIKDMNDTQYIGLHEKDIDVEAERVFRDVGKELQIRRFRDEEELFGCYLTDNLNTNDDPAFHDEQLKKVLDINYMNFEASINEVIDLYVEKQNAAPEAEENEEKDCSTDGEEGDKEDMEQDLPLTEPASPNSSDISGSHMNCAETDDIEEIRYDSDKSTDPNEEEKIKDVKQEASFSGVDDTSDSHKNYASIDDIVEIHYDSDKSTDPNEEASSSGVVRELFKPESTIITDSFSIDNSNSSDDLPSLQDIMSNR